MAVSFRWGNSSNLRRPATKVVRSINPKTIRTRTLLIPSEELAIFEFQGAIGDEVWCRRRTSWRQLVAGGATSAAAMCRERTWLGELRIRRRLCLQSIPPLVQCPD